MTENLTQTQLKLVAEKLWNGEHKALHYIGQINQFKEGHRVLLWLVRNNITGMELVNFFKDEAGDESAMGVLSGVSKAISRINGFKHTTNKLNLGDLK